MGEWEYNLKGSLVQEKEGLFTDECCSAWPANVKTWSLSSTFIYPKHDSSQSKWTCPRTHSPLVHTALRAMKCEEITQPGKIWTILDKQQLQIFWWFLWLQEEIIKESEGRWETYIETLACQAWGVLTEWTAQAHLTEYMSKMFNYN